MSTSSEQKYSTVRDFNEFLVVVHVEGCVAEYLHGNVDIDAKASGKINVQFSPRHNLSLAERRAL